MDEPSQEALAHHSAASEIERATAAVESLLSSGATNICTANVLAECTRQGSHAVGTMSAEVVRFAMIAHAKRTPGMHYRRGGHDPLACELSCHGL